MYMCLCLTECTIDAIEMDRQKETHQRKQKQQQQTFEVDESKFYLRILDAQQGRHTEFNHRISKALKMHTADSPLNQSQNQSQHTNGKRGKEIDINRVCVCVCVAEESEREIKQERAIAKCIEPKAIKS